MAAWLVNCEKSGVLRRSLRAHGIEAWSCDIEPAEDGSPFHIQADAIDTAYSRAWDGMIAHPECTYLSASGLHWNGRPGYEWRKEKTREALEFALKLWRAPMRRKILENPRGKLGSKLRNARATYVVQPWMLGDDASKETWLWCDGIELLPIYPHQRRPGRIVRDPRTRKLVERWSNQTDSGQNRLPPTPDRSAIRAETYPGIADWIARSVAAWLHGNIRGQLDMDFGHVA